MENLKNYEDLLKKYQKDIEKNPNDINTRNLLSFCYLRTGRIDDARRMLTELIEDEGNYTAYRQIVYLEKNYGSLEDAEIYALECIDKFPDEIGIKNQLDSIYKLKEDEKDDKEL